jgi:hypothetical protein
MSTHSLDHLQYYGADEKPNTPLLGGDNDRMAVVYEGEEEGCEGEGSPQKMTRNRKMVICLGVFMLSTLVFLLVIFLAIIPAIMQDITDDEEISMSTATIFNPTDDAFDVMSTVIFSDTPILPATAKMHGTELSWEGVQLAMMTHNNKLNVDTHPQPLHSSVVISDVTAMADFNVFLIGVQSFDWHIHGHADVISLDDKVDIIVDKDISMDGFDNFPIGPVIEAVSTYEGTTEYLYSLSNTVLFSPSNIGLAFGQDLHFEFKSNGIKVGIGTIPDAVFQSGQFSVNATIAMSHRTAKETAEVNNVCGRFISQMPTNVTMENFYLSKPIAWLTPALAGLHFNSVLPPVHEGVIDSLDMYVYLTDIFNVQWGGHFYNPLDAVLTLYSMKCGISFEGVVIAEVNEPDIEIVIPPKSHIISANDMHARTVVAHVKEIKDLLEVGEGLLNLDCQIHNSIGDFMVDLNYLQNDVPSTIHNGRGIQVGINGR